MDYNESANRVDRTFDDLFRKLDELEAAEDRNELTGDCAEVIEAWKQYKSELNRHMKEQNNDA